MTDDDGGDGEPVPGLRRTGIRTHEVGRRGLRAIHCAGRLWDAAQVAIDAGVCLCRESDELR